MSENQNKLNPNQCHYPLITYLTLNYFLELASSTNESVNEQQVDWDFAHEELMAKQGINLKAEMARKLKEIEEQWRKDKEEASQKFEQDRKKYENQIESLQKQVMEQSMTMSMYRYSTQSQFYIDSTLSDLKLV